MPNDHVPPPHRPDTEREPWHAPAALLAAWQQFQRRSSLRDGDDDSAERIERNPQAWCALLSRALRRGEWRPTGLQPMLVPKRSGGRRLLLVPPLADRIVQAAIAQWLQDELDPRLQGASHAYRPMRGVATAAAAVRQALADGRTQVWRADVADFFDSVDHHLLHQLLGQSRLGDARLSEVLRLCLCAEIRPTDGQRMPRDMPAALAGHCCLVRGLPQGSPLSPVLSNLVLDQFDRAMADANVTLVRYADDFVLLAADASHLDAAIGRAHAALAALGLAVNEAKCVLHVPGEPFDFLGEHFDALSLREAGGSASAADESRPTDGEATATDTTTCGEGDSADASSDDSDSEPPADLAAPLLRTLYVLEDGAQLARQGDTLVVHRPAQSDLLIPAARLSQVLAFGATSVSSGAISLCLERQIPVMLLSGRGRHFGCIDPIRPPRLALLRGQLAALEDTGLALAISQALVKAKIANSLLVLRRWARRRQTPALANAIVRLSEWRHRVARMDNLAALRGLEGSAAAVGFTALGSLLGEEWRFAGRARQPPPDPVNSMLSYGYTLLYYNTLTLVLGRGLQAHLGLYHQPRAGHHALVSDLMEPFRPLVVDAIVADLVLNGGVKPGQFNVPEREGEACLMSPDARRRLIEAFERKMDTRVDCPALGMKLDVRRLIDLQSLHLAEVLEGRLPRFEAWVAR